MTQKRNIIHSQIFYTSCYNVCDTCLAHKRQRSNFKKKQKYNVVQNNRFLFCIVILFIKRTFIVKAFENQKDMFKQIGAKKRTSIFIILYIKSQSLSLLLLILITICAISCQWKLTYHPPFNMTDVVKPYLRGYSLQYFCLNRYTIFN